MSTEYVLRQLWQTFVDDRFDLGNAKQTKTVFSYAMAVMDTIEGWEEEDWVGSRFAACTWIYTKAVICNGHENMQEYMTEQFRSIMDFLIWVCDDAPDDHEWVSESSSLVRKQKFWKLLIRTSRSHVWCIGACCGFRHREVSIEDFWTVVQSSRNTTMLSIWRLRQPSLCPSDGCTHQEFAF